MTAFLDAERLGLAGRVYTREQLRARRREARALGLSPSDVAFDPVDVSLDDVLAVPRRAWSAGERHSVAA
jgi:hypothetical protein